MRTELVVVRTDEDHREALALLKELAQAADASSAEGVARRRAQAMLIQDYENRRWPIPRATPIEVIEYLMDQHGLEPADMAPVLGTRSRVSEVLRGRRPLTIAMLRRLKARFGVPVDVFLGDEQENAA